MKFQVFAFSIFLFILRCASTEYQNPTQAQPTPEWGPKEINETVEAMVNSLEKYFQETKAKPYIEISKIQNKTTEHIDTKMIVNKIATQLTKKKIVFVDRTHREDAIAEMKIGMRGMVREDTAIKPGEFLSPNYKLSGEIIDNVQYDGGKKIQYITITLRLLKLETGGIDWQEEKEFLKVSEQPKLSW